MRDLARDSLIQAIEYDLDHWDDPVSPGIWENMDARREWEADRQSQQIGRIRALVDKGILSRELCPTPDYWHWNVLKPDELPLEFKEQYAQYGEIRWYGDK